MRPPGYRRAGPSGSLQTFAMPALPRPAVSAGLKVLRMHSPPATPEGARRIIICDYNALLHSVTGLLRMSGYCVFQAYDGQAAAELCRELPKIDLLVLNTEGTGLYGGTDCCGTGYTSRTSGAAHWVNHSTWHASRRADAGRGFYPGPSADDRGSVGETSLNGGPGRGPRSRPSSE